MTSKYYAVAVGVTPGIYDSWSEVEPMVKGFPNARYKSFPSQEKAAEFLEACLLGSEGAEDEIETDVLLYTDGSYSSKRDAIGWGYVVVANGESLRYRYGRNTDKYKDSRQIAGEATAVLQGLDWCISQGYQSVTVCHDLEHISNWISGTYKATTIISNAYVNYMKEKMAAIDVHFRKVKSHSGDKWNEMADSLAKQGTRQKLKKKKEA